MTMATTVQKKDKKEKRCHNYVGQQKKAVRHGYGVYTYTNPFFQYEGEWIDGKKHGLGKFLMNDGSYYNGEFKNGEIEGNGVRYFGLSGNKYTGSFYKGELQGQGIMEYKNGSVYEGSWENNKRQGHGILKEKDGYSYDGNFHQHKKHGNGTQHYKNGDIYTGDWIQGKRQGHGCHQTTDGTYYKGQWANDVMSGMGYIKHSSGIIYDGHWINGLPQLLATKLVFVSNQTVNFIDKEKPFNIEIQCHNDDKELIPDQGRMIQLIAGIQHQATQNTSSEKSGNAESLENTLISTPYGYSILPCPLNIMKFEQKSPNENSENDPENYKPAAPETLKPLLEEVTIKKTTEGKVVWENLLSPTSCVEKKYYMPQENKKKTLSKHSISGSGLQKSKKDNLIPEIEEKWTQEKNTDKPSNNTPTSGVEKKTDISNDFVLLAKDVTNPPFMNQRLETAFLKIKFYQQKTKVTRK